MIGAPYFRYSPDHVLRDWQLLEAACRAYPDGSRATWEIVPAVPLLVAAHLARVPLAAALAGPPAQVKECVPSGAAGSARAIGIGQ